MAKARLRLIDGKRRSAQTRNALKSGIDLQLNLSCAEDQEEFKALADEYLAQFCPATAEERQFVDILIRAHWQQRVFAGIEAQIWKDAMATFPADEKYPLGRAFTVCGRALDRLHRSMDLSERWYYAALHRLDRLQSARRAAAPAPPRTCEDPRTSAEDEFDSETPPKKPYLVN